LSEQDTSIMRVIPRNEKEKFIKEILDNFNSVRGVIEETFRHHDIPFIGEFVVDNERFDTIKNLLNIGVVSTISAVHEIAKQFTDCEESQQIVMVCYVAYMFAMIEEVAKLLRDATNFVKKEKLKELLAAVMTSPTFVRNIYIRMIEITRMLCEVAIRPRFKRTDTTIM